MLRMVWCAAFLAVAAVEASSAAGTVGFWRCTVVDNAGDVGRDTSLALLASGAPAIAYRDVTNSRLKYAYWVAGAWHTVSVDGGGSGASLGVLPGGPAVAHCSGAQLKYAWFNGLWQTGTIEGNAANDSLAVLPTGRPAVSYTVTNDRIKYAYFDGTVWQKAVVFTVGAPQDAFKYASGTSLAVLPSGWPALVCAWGWFQQQPDVADDELSYAWYDGAAWQRITIESHSSGISRPYKSPSLVVLPDGRPGAGYISGVSGALFYAEYDGAAWQIANVSTETSDFTSLAVVPPGTPVMAYHANGNLKYAWLDGTTWRSTTVDNAGSVGAYPSLKILLTGQPAISYYDAANGDLKYAVGFYRGDLNCDGVVNFGDIDPFVLALSDPAGYQQQFPDCKILNGDCNGDGNVDFADIDPFVALLSG